MKSESSEGYSKLYWIFMYSAWIFAELISLAAFGYAIYSVVILIRGNWAGAAVFAGIIPGCVLFFASMYIYMLIRIPWRAGDYQLSPPFEHRMKQVRPFHTILWNEKDSEALPHINVYLDLLEPEGKKDGFLVYHHHGSGGFRFYGRGRWLAYAWAILCEVFVLAVLSMSLCFMVWAGLEASISFLSGAVLPSVGMGIICCSRYEKSLQSSGRAHVIGLTWIIIKYHGNPHLMHFMLYEVLLTLTSIPCREQMEIRQGKSNELV